MPKVTVILTSYNHAKYLRDSIESVLNQTYTEFDLIIWDDGSTDQSWQIITSYSDPRIRAFKNETKARGAPINNVISEVETGEYIAIQHSDDIWEPQKLEKQEAFLDANPQVGAVFSHALIIGENGLPFEDPTLFYYSVFEQPNRNRYEWLNYFFYHGNALCHPSVLIRKKCYEDCGPYRYGFSQLADFDMWVRLCMEHEIYILPEKLIRFRVRSNNGNSSSSRPEALKQWHLDFFQVLNNYRDVKDPKEFLKIFPVAENYITQDGFDLDFVLAMIALAPNKLNPDTYNAAKLFAITLLFEAINNSERARKINELYGFDYTDFIELTANYDVFSIVALAEREQIIQSLTTQLNEILKSNSWKLATVIRKTRMWLIPKK